MSTVGLLFSISKGGVEAATSTSALDIHAKSDAQLQTLAESMQQAMLAQGLEAGTTSELQSLLKQHLESQLEESMSVDQSQKTNLEETNQLMLAEEVSSAPPLISFCNK